MGFPHSSVGKESACNAGDPSSIPGLGGSPWEGKGYPLQYFGLDNSINCIVHAVAKSRTRLSDFHFHGFSNSHVLMWELDHKEGWAPKNWCFWTVVLEKILESPLDWKEIKPVNPKGNPSKSLEGLMLKLKLQYFGHLMRRTDSLEKPLMLGKVEHRRRREWQKMRW